MTVHYGLTMMNLKNIVTGIFARLDFTACVWLYKHNFPRICLTPEEYREIEKKKGEVSALLLQRNQPGSKKMVVINSTLRLRLDTSYVTDMIVVERLEISGESSTGIDPKDITSVWLVSKSWFNLVHLMPALSHMLQQQEKWCDDIKDLFHQFTISDYLFTKCLLFAKVNLPEEEFRLYQKLFEIIHQQITQPDLLIYLHAPVQKLQENIKKRQRVYEQSISDEYLFNLQQTYTHYIKQHNIKTLFIDSSNADFLGNEKQLKVIIDALENDYEDGQHYLTLP